jgi:hypothetical protein
MARCPSWAEPEQGVAPQAGQGIFEGRGGHGPPQI